MNVFVLGTGTVAQVVSDKLDKLGHQVSLLTRDTTSTLERKKIDPQSGFTFKEWFDHHPGIQLLNYEDSPNNADLYINATFGFGSLNAISLIGEDKLDGKILLDLANPLDFSKGMPPSLFINNNSQSVSNNNLNHYKGATNVLVNNNYISKDPVALSYSHFDPSASYYDPGYTDSLDLHVSNPAIFSRGAYIPEVSSDIDGDFRLGAPTIGADEKCLGSTLPDSIFLQCGSVYKLKTCLKLRVKNYKWKPGNLLVDSNAVIPEVVADSIKLLWLVDNAMNIIDSVWIIPKDDYEYGSRTYYPDCGFPAGVGTYVPAGATVRWSPPGILDNPDSNFVILTLRKDTQIVATIDRGHCGIYYDTVNFIINPIPAGSYWTWDTLSCNSIIFYSNFPCRDSLEWDFGDGNISKDDTVVHAYATGGAYRGTLSIWILSQKLELPTFEIISCIDLPEVEDPLVTIFPNPAKFQINIDVKDISPKLVRMYDLTGKVILEEAWKRVIDIPQGVSGLHIIEIEAKGEFYRKRIIIEK